MWVRVQASQERQRCSHDQNVKQRAFIVGDEVYARNFTGPTVWIPGVVVELAGPLTLMIELSDGRKVRRHLNHVRWRQQEGLGCPKASEQSQISEGDEILPEQSHTEDEPRQAEPEAVTESDA